MNDRRLLNKLDNQELNDSVKEAEKKVHKNILKELNDSALG